MPSGFHWTALGDTLPNLGSLRVMRKISGVLLTQDLVAQVDDIHLSTNNLGSVIRLF